MQPLTPRMTSVLADDVYGLRGSSDISKLGDTTKEWRDIFNMPSRITGNSGGRLIYSNSGFGFVSSGKGYRRGEALVVVRGTDFLPDIFTDARSSLTSGPSGLLVHSGFMTTFKSLKGQLDDFFNESTNRTIRHVHCVGHSLGGALATLIADYCRERQMGASLYTFGSPRAGLKAFADGLTQKLGAENIFRVYHSNDPVSMVPMWPYWHLPVSGQVIMLPGNHNALNFAAHSMVNYVADLSDTEWRSLRCASNNWVQRLDGEVMKWLESGDKSILLQYGSSTLWFLSKALLHVIRLALNTTGIALSLTFMGLATVADLLCWLLEHAARLQKAINTYLKRIFITLMQALGRAVTDTLDITKAVLRFVIDYLWTSLVNLVQRAIRATFS